MPDPIDLARMREFSDDTPDGLRELCGMFVAHITEAADALRPAVAERRAVDIKAHAHKVAGAAGACGAVHLSTLLTRMEVLGAEGQLAETPALMEQIDDEVGSVRAFLSREGLIEPAARSSGTGSHDHARGARADPGDGRGGAAVMTPDTPRKGPLVLEPETEHTVKNHLAVIVGFCELLLNEVPADDPRRADVQEIDRAARALMTIFRRDAPTDASG